MNADKIANALRAKASGRFANYMKKFPVKERKPDYLVMLEAADLIESLQSKLLESQRREKAALEHIEKFQTPMYVIQKNWNPSECPRCHHDFYDYEECDDGYYTRAESLERCPYCGQKLTWNLAQEDTP